MDIVRAKKSFFRIADTKNRTRFQPVVPLQAHDVQKKSGGSLDALRLEGSQYPKLALGTIAFTKCIHPLGEN